MFGLSQPVQAFYQFLVAVDAPPGEKKENRDQEYKYGRNGMTTLMFYKPVDLFQVKEDI